MSRASFFPSNAARAANKQGDDMEDFFSAPPADPQPFSIAPDADEAGLLDFDDVPVGSPAAPQKAAASSSTFAKKNDNADMIDDILEEDFDFDISAPPDPKQPSPQKGKASGSGSGSGSGGNGDGGGNGGDAYDDEDDDDEVEQLSQNARFYELARYRRYFNVNTSDIAWRITQAILFPWQKRAWGKPDLYGPFWLATTLVFVMGVTANVSSYINWTHSKEGKSDDHSGKWIYDFEYVTTATMLIYGFVAAVPSGLYWVGRCHDVPLRWVETVTMYGYGMAIFVPVAGLCVLPHNGLRWISTMCAVAVSFLYVIVNLWHVLAQHLPKTRLMWYVGICALCHALLGLVFKVYFFNYDSEFLEDHHSSVPSPSPSPAAPSPSAAAAPLSSSVQVSVTPIASSPFPIPA